MATQTQVPDTGELRVFTADELIPWPGLNPRRRHDPDAHAELVASIDRQGIRQALAVQRRPEPPHYIVAGERRWRAAKEAGAPVPCVVGEYTLAEALEVALTENLQRADMTVVEEARGLRHLMVVAGYTQKEIAERIGMDQSWVSNRIRLLALPDEILDLLDEGRLHASHARDYLLPWKDLKPDAVRAKLYAGVAEKIDEATEEQGAALPGGDVHHFVGIVARDLSREIHDRGAYYYYGDRERPLFDPDEHDDCPCNAPAFQYSTHGGKEVRCFNEQWWSKAQRDAKKRRDREEAKKRAKREKQTAALADAGPVDAEEVEKRYRYDERETVALSSLRSGIVFKTGLVIDPSRLAAGSLLVVKHAKPNGVEYELVCTKPGSVRAAKGQLTREKKALMETRRAERLERDLAEVAGMDLEPWMAIELLALDGGNHGHNPVQETAAELDLEIPTHETREALRKMDPDRLLTLAKLYALRSRRGDFDTWGDVVEEGVLDELRAKYEPQLADLLPAAEPKEAADAA